MSIARIKISLFLLPICRGVSVPVPDSDSRYSDFFGKLTDKKLLALYEIKLINSLTGEDYTLPAGETVTVEISGINLTGAENIAIAHEKADGTIEMILATLKDGKLTFTASSFSFYGVTAKADAKQPVPSEPSPPTGDNSNMHLWIALLFVSGIGILGTATYRRKRKQLYR